MTLTNGWENEPCMNADLIKRFFRAIQADSEKDLHQLCQKIIEKENVIFDKKSRLYRVRQNEL